VVPDGAPTGSATVRVTTA